MSEESVTNDKTHCPICGEECPIEQEGFTYVVVCPSCGTYAYSFLQNDMQHIHGIDTGNWYKIAGYLFETKEKRIKEFRRTNQLNIINNDRTLNEDSINKILSSDLIPKKPLDYLNKIILNMYSSGGSGYLHPLLEFNPAIGYAKNKSEFLQMLATLEKLGYIEKAQYVKASELNYILTPNGILYAESLLNTNVNSNKVFIAMKFTDDKDIIRDQAIKPACSACGFEAFTVDEEEYIGDITDKIISSIKTSRFIVADFTDNNFGVYYEAGYAKGLGIQVIKTCRKDWFDEKIIDKKTGKETEIKKNHLHFDIEHDNLILWTDAENLKKKLEDRIRAVIL